MFSQIAVILNRKLKRVFYNNISCLSHNNNTVNSTPISEKIKGSIIENWLNYWRNLFNDYKEVALGVYNDGKDHPIKATCYVLFGGSTYYCFKHNPNEVDFREKLIQSSLKLLQIGEPIRNPISVCYIKWLEQCHNEGIIRRLNLGILSLMWLSNYDSNCALYKARCSYLQPQYTTFHERIIDIGFLDNWWVLENSMINYDVNDSEHLKEILA